MSTRYMLGFLVCGLVLVMTAVPGPPSPPPLRLRSSSAMRTAGAPDVSPAAVVPGKALGGVVFALGVRSNRLQRQLRRHASVSHLKDWSAGNPCRQFDGFSVFCSDSA